VSVSAPIRYGSAMAVAPRPEEPEFAEEAAIRLALTQAFDRQLARPDRVELCPVFRDLGQRVTSPAGAGNLTPAEQDLVVDQCLGCTRCRAQSPSDEDLPELIIRARAMQRARRYLPRSRRIAARLLAGRDARGLLGRLLSPLTDRMLTAVPNSRLRRLLQRVSGISAELVLMSGRRERLSSRLPRRWQRTDAGGGALAIMPTCSIEYRDPSIGDDLLAILERCQIDGVLATSRCCGRSLLESGDVGAFIAQAERVLGDLAPLADAGWSIMVPDAECLSVLESYPRWVPGDESTAVASASIGFAPALLARLPSLSPLRASERATATRSVTLHLPCHRPVGDRSGDSERQLLEALGLDVTVVDRCAGIGGSWGLLTDHRRDAEEMTRRLATEIETPGSGSGMVIVGTCPSANRALVATGADAVHPVQLVARVFGGNGQSPPDADIAKRDGPSASDRCG